MIKLLSVGRFTEAKNYDNVPDICRRLVNDYGEVDLQWYIIGFGGDEALIRQKIAEAGMQEHVILLGKKENPYPYIKACDIYVQPSRYEGKSVTVREAQMLCKPVVVTNYPTAHSQIRDGVDGVIVPLENCACAEGIASLINDKVKQSAIIDYLSKHDYGNESEVNKLYHMINSKTK
jgi:glycosyltransferase involved in cell wall biosynthesis